MSEAFYDTYDYTRYWRGREYEHEAERIALLKLFKKISGKEDKNIIDIGCGFGRLAEIYGHLFKNCLLVDPSKSLLDKGKKQFTNFNNLQFKQGSAEKLPAENNSEDVAVMVRVAHHLNDPSLAFQEVSRVLKPGGYFILEFANKIHFRACLRAFLRADFEFSRSLIPSSHGSNRKSKDRIIPFLNHHPKVINQKLEKAGFRIIEGLSVSNIRYPFLKKVVPTEALIKLESIAQSPLYKCYFGPSIFLYCQKKVTSHKTP